MKLSVGLALVFAAFVSAGPVAPRHDHGHEFNGESNLSRGSSFAGHSRGWGRHGYHHSGSWSWSTSWGSAPSGTGSAPSESEAQPEPTSEIETPAEPSSASEEPAPEPTTTEVETTFSAEPTSTAEAAPSASASSGSGSGTDQSEIDEWLSGHNDFRALHGADPLTWSEEVAATAQAWANNCVFEHSGGEYGENLAAGSGTDFSTPAAIKMWTDESTEYDPSNPTYSHFTQVVWKSTTELGCARATCNGLFDGYDEGTLIVCNYNPPGNYIGEFDDNVEA